MNWNVSDMALSGPSDRLLIKRREQVGRSCWGEEFRGRLENEWHIPATAELQRDILS